MLDLSNSKQITLDESQRQAVREALESYRNQLTVQLYGDAPSCYSVEYFDIEIQVVDEILEMLEGED